MYIQPYLLFVYQPANGSPKFREAARWDWYLAMAFGSIVAVTDPAGVVQVLKSSGAREALTVLITSESALNQARVVSSCVTFTHTHTHTHTLSLYIYIYVLFSSYT